MTCVALALGALTVLAQAPCTGNPNTFHQDVDSALCSITPLTSSVLDLYRDARASLVTADVVAYASSRLVARSLASWEKEHLAGWTNMLKELAGNNQAMQSPDARRIVEGTRALVDGWPENKMSAAPIDADTVTAWLHQNDGRLAEVHTSTDPTTEEMAASLRPLRRARRWFAQEVAKRVRLDEERGVPSEAILVLEQVIARHPSTAKWLACYARGLDGLMGPRVPGAPCMLASVLNRVTVDIDFMQQLDPEVIPDRTYVGALDLLVGPLRSQAGLSFWAELEHGDLVKAAALARAPDPIATNGYAAFLSAIRGITSHLPHWATQQDAFKSQQWALRQLQSQMASWACLRRTFAHLSTECVYGSRSAAPPVLVEPCPDFFFRMSIALRYIADSISPSRERTSHTNLLSELADWCAVLGEVAEGGPAAAERRQRELTEIDKTLELYFGHGGTMGNEWVEVARSAKSASVLKSGIGAPYRITLRLNINGQAVSYEGAVMTYKEEWSDHRSYGTRSLGVGGDYPWTITKR